MRTCKHCGITEDLIDFFKRKRKRKHGYVMEKQNICMACKREMFSINTRRFYKNHPEKASEQHKLWVENNREEHRRIQRKYYRKKRNYLGVEYETTQ